MRSPRPHLGVLFSTSPGPGRFAGSGKLQPCMFFFTGRGVKKAGLRGGGWMVVFWGVEMDEFFLSDSNLMVVMVIATCRVFLIGLLPASCNPCCDPYLSLDLTTPQGPRMWIPRLHQGPT